MSKLKPLHVGISVPDADASVQWYKDIFGFEVLSDDFVPPLNARIVFLKGHTFEIELFEYKGADAAPLPEERKNPDSDLKTCGVKHVAWSVENMDEEFARLLSLKVDIVKEPFPMGKDKVCFIRDNSGILIELIEKPKELI